MKITKARLREIIMEELEADRVRSLQVNEARSSDTSGGHDKGSTPAQAPAMQEEVSLSELKKLIRSELLG